MFAHLHVHSPYSFGDGASDIEQLAEAAARFHMPALALTDHNSVTAAVKFNAICRGYDLQPIIGTELTLEDESHLTLLAQTQAGFVNLSRLLTLAYEVGGRLSPALPLAMLEAHTDGLICLTGCRKGTLSKLVRAHRYQEARAFAERLMGWFGRQNLFIELQCDGVPQAERIARDLAELGDELRIGVVATNNCHYATRLDGFTHNILRSVATGTTVDQPHPDKPINCEQFIKSPRLMQRLFHWRPDAIDTSLRIAERCGDVLPTSRDHTPIYPLPAGYPSAIAYLRTMTYKGAAYRHGKISDGLLTRLEDELTLIEDLEYENYFLTAWDIVRWCRHKDRKIRVTGRGSAADSAVSYSLFLTEVDAYNLRLPFARFMARAEDGFPPKLPDIDLDFPNARRDEVFTYIQNRYGPKNVARICTYSTYWARSAVRDCGKALGLPLELVALLSGQLHHFMRAGEIESAFDRPELQGFQPLKEPCAILMKACQRIEGLPRHVSVHSSGVVISQNPVSEIGVVSPQASGVLPFVMWDKEDAPEVGINKLDILALGIHSATADAEVEINRHLPEGERFRYTDIPRNDPLTYRVLRAGEAVGAFQAESAAERAYAARLGPEHIHDLAAIIAQIRPGPIKSGVTHEYVALRNGYKKARGVPKELEEVLGPTFGLVIYQEQVISVIAWCFGCSDAEADRFRKSLGRYDKLGKMEDARRLFVQKTLAAHPGVSEESAGEMFEKDVASWFAYGFTHGHALSFADIAEKSTYMSVHHPAAYFAGILSNQPMGYYTPMSIATEARWRGVNVLPVEINSSADACLTPDPTTIRLGFCLVTGLRQEDIDNIVAERAVRPFTSLLDFARRVVIHRDRLETLILCGAFDQFHDGHRRGMMWRLPETMALARSFDSRTEDKQEGFGWDATALTTPIAWDVDRLSGWQEYVLTWQLTGVGPGAHPFAWIRSALTAHSVMPLEEVMRGSSARRIRVAGLNIRPHQPPSRDGGRTIYTTLEDEKRQLQCACKGEFLKRCTATLITEPAVIAEGMLYRSGSSWSLKIENVEPVYLTTFAEESARLEQPQIIDTTQDPLENVTWRMGYNVPTRLMSSR